MSGGIIFELFVGIVSLIMKDLVFIFDGDGVAIHAWHFARYLEQECGIGFSTTQGFFTGVFQDCMRGQAELREELEPFLLGWGWQA
ncbi:MAG: hypothetical protein KDD62_14500, partial [Bdellovibrionales bacterium]|nr:hypothetical protein [Bdellovibrionales bacterium]